MLTKQYVETTLDDFKQKSAPGWSSHFEPVVHIMASSEHTEAVRLGLQSRADLDLGDGHGLAGPAVRQVHTDFAPQQEKARRIVCKNSIAQKDYAHMIRRLLETLPSKLTQVNEQGEKKHSKPVLKAVRISRTHCTTLDEFMHCGITCLR